MRGATATMNTQKGCDGPFAENCYASCPLLHFKFAFALQRSSKTRLFITNNAAACRFCTSLPPFFFGFIRARQPSTGVFLLFFCFPSNRAAHHTPPHARLPSVMSPRVAGGGACLLLWVLVGKTRTAPGGHTITPQFISHCGKGTTGREAISGGGRRRRDDGRRRRQPLCAHAQGGPLFDVLH